MTINILAGSHALPGKFPGDVQVSAEIASRKFLCPSTVWIAAAFLKLNVSYILNVFSAPICKAPVNIICGGGVTQDDALVTASSQHNNKFSPQHACLDNRRSSSSGGETTLTKHECITV